MVTFMGTNSEYSPEPMPPTGHPVWIAEKHEFLPEDVKDFILLCGYPTEIEAFEQVIEQLRSPVLEKREPWPPLVVIILPRQWKDAEKRWKSCSRSSFQGVYLVQGDASLRQTMERVNVEKAKSALILSDLDAYQSRIPYDFHPDARIHRDTLLSTYADQATAMLSFELKQYYKEKTGRELMVGAELENTEHWCNFVRVGVEDIVSTDFIEEKMLANAVISPSSSFVFLELATFRQEDTEIYREEIPAQWDKVQTFGDLVDAFLQLGRVVIGVAQKIPEEGKLALIDQDKKPDTNCEEYAPTDYQILLFPKADQPIQLGHDQAIVIGYSPLSKEDKSHINEGGFYRRTWLARIWHTVLSFPRHHPYLTLTLILLGGCYFYLGCPSWSQMVASGQKLLNQAKEWLAHLWKSMN